MALTLPYPTQPATNSALASAPVLGNITALAQAIQAFDASQIAAGTLVAAAFNASINPNTILNDTIHPFVQSGCIWSAVSGLVGTMTGGTIYASNSSATFRVIVNGIGSHTFVASSDTYVDIDYNGNITYSAVSNNSASPSLTANSIRVAIIITGSSTISSINQGNYTATAPIVSNQLLIGVDSLGNLIYNTSSSNGSLGYAPLTTPFTGTGTTSPVQITGLTLTIKVPTPGRTVVITLSGQDIGSNTGGATVNMSLWQGVVGTGTQLNRNRVTTAGAGTLMANPQVIATLPNLPAGSYTFNGAIQTDNSSNTPFIEASSTAPGFLKAELD